MAASITLPNRCVRRPRPGTSKQGPLSSQASQPAPAATTSSTRKSPHLRIEFCSFRRLAPGVGVTGPTRSGVPLPAQAISFTACRHHELRPDPGQCRVRSASPATSRSTHHTAPAAEWNTRRMGEAIRLPLRAKRRHELHLRSRVPLPPMPVHPAQGRTGRGSGSSHAPDRRADLSDRANRTVAQIRERAAEVGIRQHRAKPALS